MNRDGRALGAEEEREVREADAQAQEDVPAEALDTGGAESPNAPRR